MVKDSGKVSTLRHHYQDDLEAFTWSALVAIGIATQDRKINSKMSEHLFIMHWLAIAKKRKLFSRSIVNELQWLIDEGKKKASMHSLNLK
ncbi:hypothetical protein [Citrobacter europaeus]|uniref:hypothetical protein n=1 Tax=Citrobacter europaeus TaxID=1914243 RepID=UPI003D6F3D49